MECESETGKTKISDSAYSNSFCKSNSLRSASSKSLLSGSNCSSGYGGIVKTIAASVDVSIQLLNKRNKDKEHKKNKLQSTILTESHIGEAVTTPITNGVNNDQDNSRIESFSTKETNIISTTDEDNGSSDAVSNNHVEKSDTIPSEDPIDKINTTEPTNGFCCVTSMYDGIVLYTSPSLTPVLGFPNNMWLGRSFSDFVHPKDRDTFSNQVTNGVAIPIIDGMGKSEDVRSSFYVCLRKYRGLKTSGYRVVEKTVSYQAFHLSVTLKHAAESSNSICLHNSQDTFLIILAEPVYSYYSVPDEIKKSSKFGMRHTVGCIFSQVDSDVVMHFGYLPQEMLGKSVFDYYHPEDLPYLKEVYQSIMVKCQIAGSVYRSKPYRFSVQNGDFVMVETEWSCFINPWSRKLEFVIGLHRVLQGPNNPDVFASPRDEKNELVSDEVLNQAQIIKEDILHVLNKELSRPLKLAKQEVTKRCKNLTTFMETVIEEVSKSNLNPTTLRSNEVSAPNPITRTLGGISPQHDYYDRESSSGTPPSYNQLNYNDNIYRFFKSEPMTNASDESDRPISATQGAADVDQEAKSLCNQRVSGSGSTGNFSSGSNPNIESGNTSATNTSNGSYEPLLLTEELILRHNEDMEKMMRKKHRDCRSNGNVGKENRRVTNKNDSSYMEKMDQLQKSGPFQGIKRSGSISWQDDNNKVLKQKHSAYDKNNEGRSGSNTNASPQFRSESNGVAGLDKDTIPAKNDLPLWPPFSMAMAPINSTTNSVPSTTGMFPVYYIPTPQGKPTVDYNDPTNYQVQYMRGMMYNPVYPASPLFCSPMAMVPFSMPQPVTPLVPEHKQSGRVPPTDLISNSPRGLVSKLQRPASQATSVKAEPGSAIGSIASASYVNRAMSECSPKDLGVPSVCSPDSPLVSSIDGEGHLENSYITTKTVETIDDQFADNTLEDEESSSSFYSSFLKTDTGSGSNDDSTGENCRKIKTNERTANEKLRRTHPFRKCDPVWMETVTLTPELVYRYQMTTENLNKVLEADMKILDNFNQPQLVNEQLNQLYLAMEMEGVSTKLNIQKNDSSSSDDDCNVNYSNKPRQKRTSFSTLMMIYEEDAPLPSDL